MKKYKKHDSQKVWLTAALGAVTVCKVSAYDVPLTYLGTNMPPLEFHGFASQGYLKSSEYNYLGESSQGSFKFTEVGLNASINPFPRTRITVQGFCFDVGEAGGYDVVLDYASAEYTFNDYLGVRAGRIRRPEGIYNDIQDVDLARTWVLLPQGMYNARWRDMYCSVDGGELFGSTPLGNAGSLSYQIYYGYQRPQLNGGLALQKENLPPNQPLNYINSPLLGGGQLWWNTPLTGLRVGAALNYDQDLTFETVKGVNAKGSPFTQHYSLEYLWGKWTFQTEYYCSKVNYNVTKSDGSQLTARIKPDTWYAGTAYRVNKWFETGVYYSEYYPDSYNRDGANRTVPQVLPCDAYQKDAALALRFDLTDWWIFKIEGHLIHGTGQLLDNNANPVRGGKPWYLLALKTTFSF
jgi:hypothetical protein